MDGVTEYGSPRGWCTTLRAMSTPAPEISIVVPIFNEEATIERLIERMTAALNAYGRPFEIVAVDDGSRDKSVQVLKDLRARDPRLRVVRLSRNFGQSPALYAGFSQVRGKYAVMIDADLQNYPEDIPTLIDKLDEGYDMVSGWRENRHDSPLRKSFSRMLNWYVARITGVPLHDVGCALKAFRRSQVDQMAQFSHRCRYLPVDMAYLGGRIAEVKVQHTNRTEGKSKYSIFKLIRTAFDIITSVTAEPLQYIGLLGLVLCPGGFRHGNSCGVRAADSWGSVATGIHYRHLLFDRGGATGGDGAHLRVHQQAVY